METVDYDLLIIGGGPAGLTAALYAARARIRTALIEKVMPGGQMVTTDRIENYPGFPEGIGGPDLSRHMADQVQGLGVPMISDAVAALDVSGQVKTLRLIDQRLTARAVIIASGASPKRLGVPGEAELFGKGISSCATCDGPFYTGKVVAAVGGGDTAVQESAFLARFARKIYLIHRRDRFRADRILQERLSACGNVEILWDTVVTGVRGSHGVAGVYLRHVKTGETRELAADGLFVWVGIVPNADFVAGQLRQDPWGFILTDGQMATDVPGVFAAGDVRHTPLRQISTAVGDGALAAHSAEHYLNSVAQ
jgi:thioredoxin reductase (NADPH)